MRVSQEPVSQADLHQLLFEATQTPPPSIQPSPITNRWWLASALQKSVRRGCVEQAQRFALALSETDPKYLWWRLAVICLEDVGPGDWVATALTIVAVRSTTFRHKLGERRVLLSIVAGLAKAVKSRSLCDMGILGDGQHPPAKEFDQSLESMDLPWIVKYVASKGKSCEMAYCAPAIQQLIAKTEPEVVNHPADPYGDELIASVPACALDTHVREGKKSFAYLSKCPPFRKFFERVGINPVKALSLVVFYEEGDHLDRELQSKTLRALDKESRRFCYASEVWSDFEDQADIDECEELVRDHREALNYARCRMVEG